MYQSHLFFISVSLRDFYHNTFYNIMIQQENLKKRLAKLAAPIFIETLLIMMLGAVDTVMLSRHSDNSVAAVGVVNQIIMLTFLVFEVINLGTSVLCSQYIGARLHKQVVQVVGVSILVNLVVGITISMLLFGCAGPILRLMGLGPELMQDGMDYMRIVGAFAFFQALSLTLSASLRSANKAVYPMLVTVVVNILNIIGNYSLIFGRFGFPELGVEGAAISTAFSRGVSMIILFVILFRKHIHSFPRVYFRPFPWVELKNLMKVGLPSAGEQLSYSSSQVVITYFINMLGVEALATRTYCVNIIMFAYLFSISMANGELTLGENIADHGGLQVAYLALQKAMTENPLGKDENGFTPEQRFFLSYGNVWAGNIRDEQIRLQTKSDPHSLGRWRVNAALPHISMWYDAFGVKEGDALYLPVEKRASIW